jgi:hypothetical protein
MRRPPTLLLLLLCGAPAQAFDWDDGHGAFPFRPVTTRHYEVAPDRVAPPKGPGGKRRGALYEVSTTHPTPSVVLRSTFEGEPIGPRRRAKRDFRGN